MIFQSKISFLDPAKIYVTLFVSELRIDSIQAMRCENQIGS